MKHISKLMLGAALVVTAAAPVLAQNVPNRLKNNITEHYALYAEAFIGLQADSSKGVLRRQMNVELAEVERLCARAEYAQVAHCIVELIPMRDRTAPHKAYGPNGENIQGYTPPNDRNNGGNNNNNNNNNNNQNNDRNGDQAQAEAEAQAQAEAEARAQAQAEAEAQAQAQAAAQAAAEEAAQAQSEVEQQAQAEADRQAQAEAERQAQAEADARAQARAEAEAQAEAEAAANQAQNQNQIPAVERNVANYSDAVRAVNQAIQNGNTNPRRLINEADAARDELARACENAGYRNINQCLNRLNLSVPEMTQVTARENSDNENAAALLDSQKDADNSGRNQNNAPIGLNFTINLPTNDADSQAGLSNQPIFSIQQESGVRVDQQPIEQRPTGRIVEDFGDRQVVERDNQFFIEGNERARLNEGASQTYYESISRNRTRETIVRPNGVRLVTIYNVNGDILQRSRFEANGSETVLIYVSPDQEQQLLNYTDPGENLPPLQLGISADEYILDADQANLNQVIDFLDSPPVEQVTRYYSIDEVKRSARIRDMVRRLEIGNLTFEFGSPNLAPDQVDGLYQLASAMLSLLQDNPGEIFLIEGHTDAVGSINANLLLSDGRAENVANLLTAVYGIPPENLATQGYGERYLKINTPFEERLNRRVTVKRITPLVAPVNVAAAG